MALLNQKDSWRVREIDFLSKFLAFSERPQSQFSLVLDGIADVIPGSEFAQTLTREELTLANAVSMSDTDINERWPKLLPMLSKVCKPSYSYDDVVKALDNEDVGNPILRYFRAITYN